MTYSTPVVSYATTIDGTYTALTGVQSVSVNRGRTYMQDPFPASSCTIELIPATSYTTALAIGQFIDVRQTNVASSPAWFVGRITGVERVYGMPFNNVTNYAPQDRIVITATGGSGALGSNQMVNFSWTTSDIYVLLSQISAAANVFIQTGSQATVGFSAQTFSGSSLDLVNTVLRTANWFMDDFDSARTSLVVGNNQINTYPAGSSYPSLSFSDTGSAQKYNAIEFLSSNNTAFSKVVVSPEGLTSQSVEAGTVYNTLSVSTYNQNTSDALSLANYLYQTVASQTTPVPFLIRTDTNVSTTCLDAPVFYPITLPFGNYLNLPSVIGAAITINFRGAAVTGVIQGVKLNFGLDSASVEYAVSPSLGQPFVLDSTVFGILNTSRLGYP